MWKLIAIWAIRAALFIAAVHCVQHNAPAGISILFALAFAVSVGVGHSIDGSDIYGNPPAPQRRRTDRFYNDEE